MKLNNYLINLKQKREELTQSYKDTYAKAEEIRLSFENTQKDMSDSDKKEWEKHIESAESISSQLETLDRQIKLEETNTIISNSIGMPSGEMSEVDEKILCNEVLKKILFESPNGKVMPTLSEEEQSIFSAASYADAQNAGYLVGPEMFVKELIKDIDNATHFRKLARVIKSKNSGSLGVPYLETDADDADWVGENTQVTPTDISVGKRSLNVNYYSKEVVMSNALLMFSEWPEEVLRERLSYKMGITEEKAFITGDGVNKPLGVLTASPEGISTNRDYTGAGSLAIDGDDIINMAYNSTNGLKEGHFNKSTWMFGRDVLAQMRLLKDDANQYIWQPFGEAGIQFTGGNPGTILGRPYVLSEYMPGKVSNAWVAGTYPIILGNFNHYWIADFNELKFTVLRELYARTNQTGIIGMRAIDGMPVLEEAFTRFKVKA